MTTLSEYKASKYLEYENNSSGPLTQDEKWAFYAGVDVGLEYSKGRIEELEKELVDKEEELGELAFFNGQHHDTIFKLENRIEELEAALEQALKVANQAVRVTVIVASDKVAV